MDVDLSIVPFRCSGLTYLLAHGYIPSNLSFRCSDTSDSNVHLAGPILYQQNISGLGYINMKLCRFFKGVSKVVSPGFWGVFSGLLVDCMCSRGTLRGV